MGYRGYKFSLLNKKTHYILTIEKTIVHTLETSSLDDAFWYAKELIEELAKERDANRERIQLI